MSKYVGYNVPFLFPVPLMFANFMYGPLMPYISTKLSLFKRVAGGLIILSFILMLLPIVAEIAPNGTGFYISLFFTFLIGNIILNIKKKEELKKK